MLRSLAYVALSVLCAVAARPLAAESTSASGPPAWQDGASVYLTMSQPSSTADRSAPAAADDTAVSPAVHAEPVERAQPDLATDRRRLAPLSDRDRTISSNPLGQNNRAGNSSPRLSDFGLPLASLYTMLSALAIVIGAFLLCAWLLRRGVARKTAAALPADVVGVLGRVPLAARQFADLLRVGNKLVLIHLTPAGATTLTEVTDPLEVDRLVGLCQQSDPHSTTKAFEQVFRQMSLEPARGGFLGDELPLPSLQSTMESFRAQRGDAHA